MTYKHGGRLHQEHVSVRTRSDQSASFETPGDRFGGKKTQKTAVLRAERRNRQQQRDCAESDSTGEKEAAAL